MTVPHPTIETLYQAARELADLLPRVADLIPAQSNQVTESTSGPRASGTVHTIPWNTPAADTYYDIHAGVRTHENALTLLLWRKAKYRPGNDQQTYEALNHIAVLIDHARNNGHADHDTTTQAASALASWPRQCRRVLDELREDEQPWSKAPGDVRCPHCGHRLELPPDWHQITNPDLTCRTCVDDNGRWLTWPTTEHIGLLQGAELITERTARQRYDLTVSRLGVWKHRGKIHPYGEDDHGRKLYRVSDITTLLDTDRIEATA